LLSKNHENLKSFGGIIQDTSN